ncbi:MAG: hypothetical protein Q8Q42_00610 [Nanoarchaeota archaeon]|nr:hypothetical protein [Nanoarchaeota archaeon]
MKQEMVTIPKKEYDELKDKVEIDEELLNNLLDGIRDIKAGRIERVK